MREPPYRVAEYVRALRALGPKVSEGQRRMLATHAAAPDRDLDVVQLAAAAGSPTPQYTYAQYGRLGHAVADTVPNSVQEWVWTRVLGHDYRDAGTDLVRWVLYEEVAVAVRKLRWTDGFVRSDPVSEVLTFSRRLPRVSTTVREALVEARIGQGPFRQRLIERWGGCAVTGCARLEGLRASHLKPWRKATNTERLDPDNGLLLLANLDALLDHGLIAFDGAGGLLCSADLSRRERDQFGIRAGMRLRHVIRSQAPYLAWHRENEFAV